MDDRSGDRVIGTAFRTAFRSEDRPPPDRLPGFDDFLHDGAPSMRATSGADTDFRAPARTRHRLDDRSRIL
jgi:hypothetical protein